MLHNIISKAPKDFRMVLASGSPRRRVIFSQIGIAIDIVESTFEENLDKSLFSHPKDFAMENAKQKALEVCSRLLSQGTRADVVIGADSVVVINDKILEKPKTKERARDMLKSLSGNVHEVYTGVALVDASCKDESSRKQPVTFYESTEVEFSVLNSDIIEAYVDTEEPLDKAGAYGIQGIGGTLVKGIRGDYYNVVGFPLHRFCLELQRFIGVT